mmetsp:Transcript_82388/g.230340  ORF Transcript_82388/g.230340 Transcript_82388/m.230340 type:complete len:443 (+) Transcript_82388:465-1793(+)
MRAPACTPTAQLPGTSGMKSRLSTCLQAPAVRWNCRPARDATPLASCCSRPTRGSTLAACAWRRGLEGGFGPRGSPTARRCGDSSSRHSLPSAAGAQSSPAPSSRRPPSPCGLRTILSAFCVRSILAARVPEPLDVSQRLRPGACSNEVVGAPCALATTLSKLVLRLKLSLPTVMAVREVALECEDSRELTSERSSWLEERAPHLSLRGDTFVLPPSERQLLGAGAGSVRQRGAGTAASHGCCKHCRAVGRSSGLVDRSWRTNSRAPVGNLAMLCTLTELRAFFARVSFWLGLWKGPWPARHMYRSAPAQKQSALVVSAGEPGGNISGGRYPTLPTLDLAASMSHEKQANPKSTIFTRLPQPASIRFSGLISLWITPRLWRASSPLNTCRITSLAHSSGSGPRRARTAWSSPPGRYSVTRAKAPMPWSSSSLSSQSSSSSIL